MKKIQSAILMLVACFAASGAMAQEEGLLRLKVDYTAGIPLGSFKNNAVSQASWRGFSGELLYHIDNRWAVGLSTGFQDFYQKYPRQLYKASDGSDVSAVVTNSIQTSPILAKGQFSFLPGMHVIKPYVALGVGGNIITYRQFVGEYDDDKNSFRFAAQPELGVNILFGGYTGGVGLNIAAAYNYMPFSYNGLSNLNNLGVKAGINIPLK